MLASATHAIQQDIDRDARCGASCTRENPVVSHVWTTWRCLVAPHAETHLSTFPRAQAAAHEAGWPVVHRRSGGLTVPNGDGVLNLTIAWLSARPESVHVYYKMMCGVIMRVLQRQGIDAKTGPVNGAFCDGRYDISVDGRKIVGTAQRWEKHTFGTIITAHALILTDLDASAAVAATNLYYAHLEKPRDFKTSSIVTLGELGADSHRFEADLRAAALDIDSRQRQAGA